MKNFIKTPFRNKIIFNFISQQYGYYVNWQFFADVKKRYQKPEASFFHGGKFFCDTHSSPLKMQISVKNGISNRTNIFEKSQNWDPSSTRNSDALIESHGKQCKSWYLIILRFHYSQLFPVTFNVKIRCVGVSCSTRTRPTIIDKIKTIKNLMFDFMKDWIVFKIIEWKTKIWKKC